MGKRKFGSSDLWEMNTLLCLIIPLSSILTLTFPPHTTSLCAISVIMGVALGTWSTPDIPSAEELVGVPIFVHVARILLGK